MCLHLLRVVIRVETLPGGVAQVDLGYAGERLDQQRRMLLNQWGGGGSADLNDDGVVDGADLGVLLNNWRQCPKQPVIIQGTK